MKNLVRFVLVALTLQAFTAVAANRVVPYQGRLERDGQPQVGLFDMRFDLYAAATGGNPVWTENQTVNVVAGTFSVALGQVAPLNDSLFQANETLFISISVKSVNDSTMITLSNRQKLLPVGYAVRSELAKHLDAGTILATGITSGTVVVTSGTNQSVPPVTPSGSIVMTGRDSAGNASLELRSSGGTPYIDLTVDNLADFSSRIIAASSGVQFSTQGTMDLFAAPSVTATSLQVTNGVSTTYQTELTRYTIRATASGSATFGTASRVVAIDQTRLASMCSDEDGCMVRLIMENFSPPNQGPKIHAAIGPFHFSYNDSTGWWRLGNGSFTDPNTGGGVASRDGDGTVNHVLRAWDCYFTDGQYTQGVGASTDPNMSLFLLNWNDVHVGRTCVLIIDD